MKYEVIAPLAEGAVFSERLTVLNDMVAWDLTGQRDPKNCIDLDPFTVYQSPVWKAFQTAKAVPGNIGTAFFSI